MPRPQSVKTVSNDVWSSCNFEVAFSKTPCFSASDRQGSRKLRPAKAVAFSAIGTYEGLSKEEIDARCEYYRAVATADKVERVKQIDLDLAERTATFEYYADWAEMTAIGQNGLGWNLSSGGSGTDVMNLLSHGLGRVGEWQFDDYTQKNGTWVMHGYYPRVYNYFSPITYRSGNFYFGGYENMHGCSDESCGSAYHHQILYDFYKPSSTAAYEAFRATLNSEAALAKEQRTADVATAFAAYNAKYCDLYYDSEEATWGFEEQYLELDIATYTRYHDDLWSAYATCNENLIAADADDNSLAIQIDSAKTKVGNVIAYNNTLASNLGQFQIDWRQTSDRYPGSAAKALDIGWAGNVSTTRNAYYSALGTAYTTLADSSLAALASYSAAAFSANSIRFGNHFVNENTYSDALLDAKSEHARGRFDADKTKGLAFVENDITNRKAAADYEAELARSLVSTLTSYVGPDVTAFTTKQNSLRSANLHNLADKKSDLSAAETAANKAATAACSQTMRQVNTTYNNANMFAALARDLTAKAIDAAYRDAMNAAADVYDTALAVANATYANTIASLASRWQAGLEIVADGGSVPGNLFAQTGNGSGPVPKQGGGGGSGGGIPIPPHPIQSGQGSGFPSQPHPQFPWNIPVLKPEWKPVPKPEFGAELPKSSVQQYHIGKDGSLQLRPETHDIDLNSNKTKNTYFRDLARGVVPGLHSKIENQIPEDDSLGRRILKSGFDELGKFGNKFLNPNQKPPSGYLGEDPMPDIFDIYRMREGIEGGGEWSIEFGVGDPRPYFERKEQNPGIGGRGVIDW